MSTKNDHAFNITISTTAILKIVGVFVLFYFLYLIRDIVLVVFISLVLSSAFDPWVDWMQRKRIPRAVGILFIYFVLAAIVGGTMYLLAPVIFKEIADFSASLPSYIEKISQSYSAVREYSVQHGLLEQVKSSFGTIASNLQSAATNIFSGVFSFFGGLFSLILIAVMIFYMTVEEEAIKKLVWALAPQKKRYYVMSLINRMQKKINAWLRGQIILSFSIFILTYFGLLFIPAIEPKLVLALIAGICETIPYLGPMISAIPAILLALTQSPTLAIVVAIIYYIIQGIENNFLVPKIMQKTVGLNPIVSIVVLMVGFNIGGIMGAILSIPVATAASVFIGDILEERTMDGEVMDED